MKFRIPHSAFRILAALWRLNLAEELQYRANFVASVLGTLFWIGTALLTLALFFRHTTRLGGWDYWEVVVLLGVFNALTGVIEAVLRPGIGRLAGEVRSGGLDLVLAKPVGARGTPGPGWAACRACSSSLLSSWPSRRPGSWCTRSGWR